MKKNVGKTDKLIRLLLGILFTTLYLFDIIQGTLGIVLIVVSLVFLLTSFLEFCPLYALINKSTRKDS